MKKPILKVEELTVSYENASALWDICFEVFRGELVGIIGPNGAGKSTLLKALIGLVKPLSGKVTFWGTSFRRARRKVSYVPQRGTIDWSFPITAFDVVLMGRYASLKGLKWYRRADREMADKLLRFLDMQSLKHRQISELSGGQQQRLFLARALMSEADLYLLDEPFTGVDKATELLIIETLKNLKQEGKTILVVHHDLNTVEAYFNTTLILKTSLIAFGKTEKVFTLENLNRAYGKKGVLFDEAFRLSKHKSSGLV